MMKVAMPIFICRGKHTNNTFEIKIYKVSLFVEDFFADSFFNFSRFLSRAAQVNNR
jgi:hypothetical protein